MLQLHHEKVQVEAGGFFPVDFTIIFSVSLKVVTVA
jgi:hypothetical protein